MIRATLETLDICDLFNIARLNDLPLPNTLDVSHLIDLIEEFFEDEKIDRESQLNLAAKMELFKFQVSPVAELSYSLHKKIFLPLFYNVEYIHMIQRDPSWLYVYWEYPDRNREKHPYSDNFKLLVLEQKEIEKNYFQYYLPINLDSGNQYINIPSGTRTVQVFLCYQEDDEKQAIRLLTSNKLSFVKAHQSVAIDTEFISAV